MTPRSEAADASITRLLWREQIRALPRSLRAAARRLTRREPRWYYVIDGRVVGRLTSAEDYDTLMQWIATLHGETFDFGVAFGREAERAVHTRQEANAGEPGPS